MNIVASEIVTNPDNHVLNLMAILIQPNEKNRFQAEFFLIEKNILYYFIYHKK